MTDTGKHTPGNWSAVEGLAIFDGATVVVSDQIEDAIICSLGHDVPEVEANARLIAAAPDLLEALSKLSTEAAIYQQSHMADCDCEFCVAIKRADEALQKATVETKAGGSKPQYWCCKADFGQHEPTCKNFVAAPEVPAPDVKTILSPPCAPDQIFQFTHWTALSGAPSTQREQCDQPCHLAGLVNPSPCRKPKGHDGYCDPAIYVNSGAPSNPPKQIESEDKWYAINRLLEPWRKIWDGDKAQFSAQYPDWIVNAAAELFAHDLCDAWDWNDYVRAAAVIIARHAPLTPTKKSPFQSACRHGVPLTVTCQDCMLATDLPESSTPTPPKEQK